MSRSLFLLSLHRHVPGPSSKNVTNNMTNTIDRMPNDLVVLGWESCSATVRPGTIKGGHVTLWCLGCTDPQHPTHGYRSDLCGLRNQANRQQDGGEEHADDAPAHQLATAGTLHQVHRHGCHTRRPNDDDTSSRGGHARQHGPQEELGALTRL